MSLRSRFPKEFAEADWLQSWRHIRDNLDRYRRLYPGRVLVAYGQRIVAAFSLADSHAFADALDLSRHYPTSSTVVYTVEEQPWMDPSEPRTYTEAKASLQVLRRHKSR